MKRGDEILREKIIEPYFEKNEEYIGIEFEYPLIFIDREVNSNKCKMYFTRTF